MISVAFIIPHMGRENLLVQTLISIAELENEGFEIEVVVASKNDKFSDELLAFSSKLKIEFLSMPMSVTISDQRNIGVKKTNSEFLAFIDADISLSRNWLQSMHALLTQKKYRLVSAKQITSTHPSPLEQVRTLLSNHDLDTEVEFLPGRNLFLSKDTFEQSGGFPSKLVTCEDYVFTQRVAKLGALFYTSAASYIHLGEDTEYWAMAKKEVWRGQSNLASIKGRKIPLSEYPSFVIPPVFTLCLIVSILTMMFSLPIFGLFSVCMWISILLAYSLRLFNKSKGGPSLVAIVSFYGLYFPARTIGTLIGALKTIKTGDY